jgi:DTW domain-containing protein YfiP
MVVSRKRKTVDPCEICRLHRDRCICARLPRLHLKTKVSLVIHAKELKRTTNTGRLALHALVNSEMRVRGFENQRLDLSTLLSDEYESYVLYPSDDALDIETVQPAKPVQLIVADGNWRQAGKLNHRHPEIAHLPRVKISARNRNSYFLRKEHFEHGFSTLEAIALALGALEGDEIQHQLLDLYRAKLAATLIGRGLLKNVDDLPALHG